PPRTAQFREAVSRMRRWWDGQIALEPPDPASLRPRPCCATPGQRSALRRLYHRLHRERFRGRLPDDITLRLSDRMSRRLGHVHYAQCRDGRYVEEIALNVDLMIPGNERHLVDTLLHEMAHVEAWLRHGQREHGPVWKAIARRVGCEDRACTHVRIRRRRGRKPVTTVPRVASLVG